jgi:hypothetical protein
MGSISPDTGYVLGPSGLEDISHRFFGGLCFGLVMGLAMLFIFKRLAPMAVKFSPRRCRATLVAVYNQPPNPTPVLGISVLIGTATHLLLDSFTHARGWFVQHIPVLQSTIMTINSHQVRVCHFLWYAASFIGIAWLVIAFQSWRQAAVPGTAITSMWSRVFAGLLAAILVLPIEIAHHLVRSRVGLILVTLLSVALAAGAMVWIAGFGPKPVNDSRTAH